MRVATHWFTHETVDEGILRILEPHVDPFLRANVYLVRGRDRDLLVDAGLGLVPLRRELGEVSERPVVAVATHRHFDHVGGLHEFDDAVVHRDDAEVVAAGSMFASVRIEDYPPEELAGYDPPASLLTAWPREGFDPAGYRIEPAVPTRVVEDGDVIDLGDRRFEVLHLPGHTPGELGLWEEETGILFSGDCVYESGLLLDELPESDIAAYAASMRRLRDLPVRLALGGHDDPFGRERLLAIVRDYLAARDA